jgi:hypothetical protein
MGTEEFKLHLGSVSNEYSPPTPKGGVQYKNHILNVNLLPGFRLRRTHVCYPYLAPSPFPYYSGLQTSVPF